MSVRSGAVFSSNASFAASAAGSHVEGQGSNPPVFPEAGDELPMEPSMVCTCVVDLGPRICFATYDEDSNEIIMEETACSGSDFSVIAERYFSLVRPNLILVGNSIVGNEGFLEALTKPLPQPHDENASQAQSTSTSNQQQRPNAPSIPFRVLKSGAFDSRNCMSIIMQKLRVVSLLKSAHRQGPRNLAMADPSRHFQPTHHRSFPISDYHMLATIIDLQSQLQVKALGALLSFLHSTIFKLEAGGTISVANVVHSQSSKYMSLNASTVAALQVFATEHHPLMASKGRGNSKEGSSLFSLLDRTQSRGGREMLRNWMLKPLLDREEILQRQDGVELCLSPILDSESSIGALMNLLSEVGPINQILARMQKCTALPMDFVSLIRTLSAANDICDVISTDLLDPLRAHVAMQEQAAAVNPQSMGGRGHKAARYGRFLEKILRGCNTSVLSNLLDRISGTVDEDSTCEARDMVFIRKGVSTQLDELKETYESLQGHLDYVCGQIMQDHPELGDIVVVFLPQVGFLIGIPKRRVFHHVTGEMRMRLPPDFSHICDKNEEGISYFKNSSMAEMDTHFGDLDGQIKDEEAMIVSALEDDILDQETDLRETFLALSELDCIISFAITAKDRQYVRPIVIPQQEVSTTIVQIRNGRHPLQEILVEGKFIPNHIDIDGEKRVNVVTGPNFSGKSCYARQVGVLVYLTQIGSYLPCEAAQISIVDQIFAQFSSVETCAVPQSSFQLDLTQMGTILRRATARSMILIDEFGKGTSPASGIALLTAALKKHSSVGTAVVCTTHFLEMFSRKLLVDGENGIKALRMAVHVPRTETEVAEPLFRLEQGVADSSAGIVCAKMAGLQPAVVERANEIVCALKEGNQLLPVPALIFSPAVSDVLGAFLSRPSWENATDVEVYNMLQKISML